MIFKLITSLFLTVAIVCFFNLSPKQITDDLLKLSKKEETIREIVRRLKTGKKKRSIKTKLIYIQSSLESMGKGEKFPLVICSSLLLFVVGIVLAVIIGNVFLIPAFAFGCGCVPFVYVLRSMEKYEKRISDELETTLSTLTSSYIRTGDITRAIEENLPTMKPPLKKHFEQFVFEIQSVSADTKRAISNLRTKVDDDIFKQWCDSLAQCMDDSSLKDTLQPIVSKLSNVRQVNMDISATMAEARMEYYTMVGLVIGNLPLLYMLNKDWFDTLINSVPGKFTLGVCGAVIFVTYIFMVKFTRPIKFRG